ncbi:MAG: conjugal transfer protein TraD [Phenylobacterium sp.]|uniref:conjugal transfer protein TraD n=1 Tax=Phenylobacterium sp. TaxID=1871053 RepID=UPI001A3581CD|nr:conjugal transfer protein TraD [Phenylobacterium sp.]MBJ7412908.1 conjugal transfer protein TraD [Phenylobacterium sp.]
MRKPRDIDAELKALADKAKGLKARKITQLGELVAATGADGLDVDTLAGALLAAQDCVDEEQKEAWRRKGAAFFQRKRRREEAGRQSENHAGGAP